MKSYLIVAQLKARIQQLNSLIAKFPTVRSLVRKWGFELVTLEGQVETLEAQKPEEPKQLTIWDIKPMSNFEKLVAQFDGNKKAASYVLNASKEGEDLEEILSHFHQRHHTLIKDMIANEKQNENDPSDKLSDKLDELIGHLARFEPIFKGSQKQSKWAGHIFAKACEHFAIAVLDGDLSQEEAEIKLQNSDAKYWIDNRKEFGMN
jgi:hypothetical protein